MESGRFSETEERAGSMQRTAVRERRDARVTRSVPEVAVQVHLGRRRRLRRHLHLRRSVPPGASWSGALPKPRDTLQFGQMSGLLPEGGATPFTAYFCLATGVIHQV